MTKFPKIVNLLCNKGGIVVGSAADPNNEDPRDIDILVPYEKWKDVAPLIPKDVYGGTIPNTFGGWKFVSEHKEIDVWPDDLSSVLKTSMNKYVYFLNEDIIYKRVS